MTRLNDHKQIMTMCSHLKTIVLDNIRLCLIDQKLQQFSEDQVREIKSKERLVQSMRDTHDGQKSEAKVNTAELDDMRIQMANLKHKNDAYESELEQKINEKNLMDK
jgi:hypothetical protein